jgi:hypothetical protein
MRRCDVRCIAILATSNGYFFTTWQAAMQLKGWPAIRSSFAYSGSPPTLADYLASYGGHPSPES